MKKIIQIKNQADQILIQTSEIERIRKVTSAREKFDQVTEGLEEGFRKIESIIKSFQTTVSKKELTIKSAELEFGFSFTGKGSIYVVQSEVEANFKVKVTIERSKD